MRPLAAAGARATYRRLLGYLAPHRGRFILGVGPGGQTVYEVSLPTGGHPPGPPSIGYRGTTYVAGVDSVIVVA